MKSLCSQSSRLQQRGIGIRHSSLCDRCRPEASERTSANLGWEVAPSYAAMEVFVLRGASWRVTGEASAVLSAAHQIVFDTTYGQAVFQFEGRKLGRVFWNVIQCKYESVKQETCRANVHVQTGRY